jgi:FemAB family
VQGREGWRPRRVILPGGGLALVLVRGRGPLRWGYVPRGPVPARADALAELVGWARAQGLARLVIEPETGPELAAWLAGAGFRRVPARQPKHTLIVPLGAPEAMLATFKPKHRYNIRLAERRGVRVDEGRDAEEMARQQAATAARQGIRPYRVDIYQHRLALLPWCRTYVARHGDEALAAITVAHHAGRAYYLYGGSTGAQSQLMPTYAVQWAAMRAAQRAGCRDYDLWGLPPDPDPEHPWHGLWQFKKGFGGAFIEYVGAWEIALTGWAAAAAPGSLAGDAVKRLRFWQR